MLGESLLEGDSVWVEILCSSLQQEDITYGPCTGLMFQSRLVIKGVTDMFDKQYLFIPSFLQIGI